MFGEPEANNQISKYNDAGYSISRLHEMWLECAIYRKQGNFKKWNFQMDIIYDELYPDVLRSDKRKELDARNRFWMIHVGKCKTKATRYFSLMGRQKFLRELQDLSGKAGVYVDENEEGFE